MERGGDGAGDYHDSPRDPPPKRSRASGGGQDAMEELEAHRADCDGHHSLYSTRRSTPAPSPPPPPASAFPVPPHPGVRSPQGGVPPALGPAPPPAERGAAGGGGRGGDAGTTLDGRQDQDMSLEDSDVDDDLPLNSRAGQRARLTESSSQEGAGDSGDDASSGPDDEMPAAAPPAQQFNHNAIVEKLEEIAPSIVAERVQREQERAAAGGAPEALETLAAGGLKDLLEELRGDDSDAERICTFYTEHGGADAMPPHVKGNVLLVLGQCSMPGNYTDSVYWRTLWGAARALAEKRGWEARDMGTSMPAIQFVCRDESGAPDKVLGTLLVVNAIPWPNALVNAAGVFALPDSESEDEEDGSANAGAAPPPPPPPPPPPIGRPHPTLGDDAQYLEKGGLHFAATCAFIKACGGVICGVVCVGYDAWKVGTLDPGAPGIDIQLGAGAAAPRPIPDAYAQYMQENAVLLACPYFTAVGSKFWMPSAGAAAVTREFIARIRERESMTHAQIADKAVFRVLTESAWRGAGMHAILGALDAGLCAATGAAPLDGPSLLQGCQLFWNNLFQIQGRLASLMAPNGIVVAGSVGGCVRALLQADIAGVNVIPTHPGLHTLNLRRGAVLRAAAVDGFDAVGANIDRCVANLRVIDGMPGVDSAMAGAYISTQRMLDKEHVEILMRAANGEPAPQPSAGQYSLSWTAQLDQWGQWGSVAVGECQVGTQLSLPGGRSVVVARMEDSEVDADDVCGFRFQHRAGTGVGGRTRSDAIRLTTYAGNGVEVLILPHNVNSNAPLLEVGRVALLEANRRRILRVNSYPVDVQINMEAKFWGIIVRVYAPHWGCRAVLEGHDAAGRRSVVLLVVEFLGVYWSDGGGSSDYLTTSGNPHTPGSPAYGIDQLLRRLQRALLPPGRGEIKHKSSRKGGNYIRSFLALTAADGSPHIVLPLLRRLGAQVISADGRGHRAFPTALFLDLEKLAPDPFHIHLEGAMMTGDGYRAGRPPMKPGFCYSQEMLMNRRGVGVVEQHTTPMELLERLGMSVGNGALPVFYSSERGSLLRAHLSGVSNIFLARAVAPLCPPKGAQIEFQRLGHMYTFPKAELVGQRAPDAAGGDDGDLVAQGGEAGAGAGANDLEDLEGGYSSGEDASDDEAAASSSDRRAPRGNHPCAGCAQHPHGAPPL